MHLTFVASFTLTNIYFALSNPYALLKALQSTATHIIHLSIPMSDSKPKGFAALMKMRKKEKKEDEEIVKPVIREASLSCIRCQ